MQKQPHTTKRDHELGAGIHRAQVALYASGALEEAVTGRTTSVFDDAFASATREISAAIEGKRILVTGAAGSIGSAVTEIALEFAPSTLLAADVDENGLAELVRFLRSSGRLNGNGRVEPLLLDITSDNVALVPGVYGNPDAIMNLAAVKHVRSERDLLSLIRMFETNVAGTRNLQTLLESCNPDGAFFSVSSDKAVNPTSLMGASKRLMELEMARGGRGRMSSCRFANVAFSAGSLLDSWLKRIANGQPTPVPADVRRYFITSREAGQLCLLTLARANKEILVPALSVDQDLQPLTSVLDRVLMALELRPEYFDDEQQAIAAAGRLAGERRQAVIITAADTSGEKMFEEFLEADCPARDIGLSGVLATDFGAVPASSSATLTLLGNRTRESRAAVRTEDLVNAVAADVPTYNARVTEARLDDRV
jgi:FlaA1/EpsC-like NDP-sugar epimerase